MAASVALRHLTYSGPEEVKPHDEALLPLWGFQWFPSKIPEPYKLTCPITSLLYLYLVKSRYRLNLNTISQTLCSRYC